MNPAVAIMRFVAGAGLILLAGCAGYQLGPTNGLTAGSRSIQVNPFVNKTPEPRLIEPTTSALRKRLQQDGTYRLATQNDGDIVVRGIITKFERFGLSFQSNDVLTAQDYTLVMTAEIIATERISGKTNLNRLVTGGTTIRIGSDLASAERQAVPLLANDLARKVTLLLVDGTW